ncbi:TPA: DNA-directed RNA polymerase subunit beta [Streptococcus agalactiae]
MASSGWKYVLKQIGLIVLVILLALLFLAVGLMLGYSVFDDGEHAYSILSLDKWQNIIGKFLGK